jgi:hypothetical protein
MGNAGYGNSSQDAPAADPAPDAPAGTGGTGTHPAGPHAEPGLTDDAKTPGTGALAEATVPGGDADPGSG